MSIHVRPGMSIPLPERQQLFFVFGNGDLCANVGSDGGFADTLHVHV